MLRLTDAIRELEINLMDAVRATPPNMRPRAQKQDARLAARTLSAARVKGGAVASRRQAQTGRP